MPVAKSFTNHASSHLLSLTSMDIIEVVKALNLPLGHYVVFGSGPMAAHGIRQSRDIDLLVTNKLYEQLKDEGWQEKAWDEGGGYRLVRGVFEADDSWNYGSYNPTPEEIISKSGIIDGIPFAPLDEVVKWKQTFGRPKDLTDVELIEQFLKGSK